MQNVKEILLKFTESRKFIENWKCTYYSAICIHIIILLGNVWLQLKTLCLRKQYSIKEVIKYIAIFIEGFS